MRVNVYAEEMTDRIEIISKTIDGHAFTGLRIYLELPVTVGGTGNHRSDEGPSVFPPIDGRPAQVAGPFVHRPGDDGSSAVTFWGKRDLRGVLRKALAMLDEHYAFAASADRWDAAADHLISVKKQYEQLMGTPGVAVGPALMMTFEPLLRRYNSGERTEQLYEAMMGVK